MAAVLCLTSCIKDVDTSVIPQGDGELAVTLTATIPGVSIPQTRALTSPEEQTLRQVKVIAFNASHQYLYVRDGVISNNTAVGSNGGGGALISFTVPMTTANVYFVVVANANNEVMTALASAVAGSTLKTAILNAMTKIIPAGSNWNAADGTFAAIPMHGETTAAPLAFPAAARNVTLTRIMARINISAGTIPTSTFQMTSVRLYATYTGSYIAPGHTPKSEWMLDYGLRNEFQHYELSAGDRAANALNNTIYTFEQPPFASPYNSTSMVVGGYYNGSTYETYYALAMLEKGVSPAPDKYLNALRNHSYVFNITSIDGPGYFSPIDALQSEPMNYEANLQVWNEHKYVGIVTDGANMLGVSQKEYVLSAKGRDNTDTDNILTVRTNYFNGWIASVCDDLAGNTNVSNDAVTGLPWLKLSNGGHLTYSNVDTDTWLLMAPNTTISPRTAYIHVRAGRLDNVVKVTQNPSIAALSILDNSGNDITELVFGYGISPSPPIVAQAVQVLWEGAPNVVITSASGTPAFAYAAGSDQPSGTITGGTQAYSIKSADATPAELLANPFLVKERTLTFTLTPTNGAPPITKTLTLRQGAYSIAPTLSATPYTLSSATPGTINVKANTPWAAELLVSGNAITALTSGQTGAGNTTTGETLQFTLAQGTLSPEFYMAQSQIRFYSPTGKAPDVIVNVVAYWLIWVGGVGYIPDNVSSGLITFLDPIPNVHNDLWYYNITDSNGPAARYCTDKGAAYRLPNREMASAWIASVIPVPAGGPYWVDEYGYRNSNPSYFGTPVCSYCSNELLYSVNMQRMFTRYATTLTQSKTLAYTSQVNTLTSRYYPPGGVLNAWNYQFWWPELNGYYTGGGTSQHVDPGFTQTIAMSYPNAYTRCLKQVYPAVP